MLRFIFFDTAMANNGSDLSRQSKIGLKRTSDAMKYPMSGVGYPGTNDVMLGRGGESNYHSGNANFRHLADKFKERYKDAPRLHKPQIAMEVVLAWRSLNPPGRFLTRTYPGRADSVWHDVGDEIALRRTTKTLGEKTQRERKAQKQSKRPRTDSSVTDYKEDAPGGSIYSNEDDSSHVDPAKAEKLPLSQECFDSSTFAAPAAVMSSPSSELSTKLTEFMEDENIDNKGSILDAVDNPDIKSIPSEEALDTSHMYFNHGESARRARDYINDLPTAAELTNLFLEPSVMSRGRESHSTQESIVDDDKDNDDSFGFPIR